MSIKISSNCFPPSGALWSETHCTWMGYLSCLNVFDRNDAGRLTQSQGFNVVIVHGHTDILPGNRAVPMGRCVYQPPARKIPGIPGAFSES